MDFFIFKTGESLSFHCSSLINIHLKDVIFQKILSNSVEIAKYAKYGNNKNTTLYWITEWRDNQNQARRRWYLRQWKQMHNHRGANAEELSFETNQN